MACLASSGGSNWKWIPVIGSLSGREKTVVVYRSCDLKKSSSASRSTSYTVPFRAPIKNSFVDEEFDDDSKPPWFHAMLSMTILMPLSGLNFFHPLNRYQFSPCVDVTITCLPDGSRKTLYSVISLGFRCTGIFTTCSGRESSIMMRLLFERPMTSRSEQTASEMIGAGGEYCTFPNSNIGIADWSCSPSCCVID